MITQLTQLIQMKTPLGDGWAILVEGTAHDYFWTVALDSGAIVTFSQEKVRIAESYTHGRGMTDERMWGVVARRGAAG